MIDLKINDDGCADIAFVRASELLQGKTIFYLGGNTKQADSEVKTGAWGKIYSSSERYYEREISSNITHETIHIVLFKLFKSLSITRMFDNIDSCEDRCRISRY